MVGISTIGIPFLVLAAAGQWWLKTDQLRSRHVLVAAGLSFILGLALNQVILLFIHRIRPYDSGMTHLLIERSADFSFPSDHATASFAIAATFLLHGMTRRGLCFTVAAGLMMLSRVYVGTHYVSDVLGGCLTRFAAAALVRFAFREGTRADNFMTSIL